MAGRSSVPLECGQYSGIPMPLVLFNEPICLGSLVILRPQMGLQAK